MNQNSLKCGRVWPISNSYCTLNSAFKIWFSFCGSFSFVGTRWGLVSRYSGSSVTRWLIYFSLFGLNLFLNCKTEIYELLFSSNSFLKNFVAKMTCKNRWSTTAAIASQQPHHHQQQQRHTSPYQLQHRARCSAAASASAETARLYLCPKLQCRKDARLDTTSGRLHLIIGKRRWRSTERHTYLLCNRDY